ncbi:MAG TPA: mechanosensitive ion channel family protein, partial [bacterium]|nr:mechanosensitive ion channel family protein [bacterium]
MDLQNIKQLFVEKGYLQSALQIVLVFVVVFLVTRLINLITKKLTSRIKKQKPGDGEFAKRIDTLRSVFKYVFQIIVFVIAAIIILGELGIEIGPILAAAGVVGVAVGFGAQSLVKDVISGTFILVQDQIRVGDWVEVAGKEGQVESVNLKMTRLRDISGNVHFIPNGEITVVTNKTRDYSKYVYDVGVAYKEDVDQVMGVMKEIDEELRQDADYKDFILEPLEILGLDKFGDSAVIIKAVSKTLPLKHKKVGREYQRRLKKRFDKDDIEIPFPHLTLYYGEEKPE